MEAIPCKMFVSIATQQIHSISSFQSTLQECIQLHQHYLDQTILMPALLMLVQYKYCHCCVGIFLLFYQGYKRRNAYIATQCPLVSTVDSFWRMLLESPCVVLSMIERYVYILLLLHTQLVMFYYVMFYSILGLFAVLANKRDRLRKC